ncbi:MAG: type II toxin-antitoxin system RelE/ParE family toxin [Acidobacteria bacterium]|nr:type II toxin-antitoxin system RelE/ParE family toxin [Acidobacteriota bacterium]
MIKSFRSKSLKDFFESGSRRGIRADLAKRIWIRLDVIDAATSLRDIDLPGFRLHELKGDRAGTWSVWVSGNWRITFKFAGGDAQDVDLEDYH